MNILNPVIVFSVFNLDKSYGENKQIHDKVLDLLKSNSINYKELDGVYKGIHETSILVNDTIETRTLVNQIAMKYNQECIMLLDANRHAMLSNVVNGNNINVGQLLSSKDRPDALNYSYDKASDTYYYTKNGM